MRTRAALCSLLLLVTLVVPAAQVRPLYDRGAGGLARLLGRLQTTASALHTGAHPDDEDSALIARLARGDFARVAYLSLNRGEGGQNIIGTELVEALGVIRTEELLQARRLDGGEQYFTRTFDYGFSKTRAEAAAKWGEREVLADMVRVIRTHRPLVVASRFAGTPADGHGQHQLAGYLTPAAFRAAADPNELPEQLREGLRPWQAKKLYVGEGFRPDPQAPPTTRIATGTLVPVIGRTFTEIAMEGRSQHKSQEMGVIELRGPQQSMLRLLQPPARPARDEASLFDGLDVSLSGLPALAGLPPGSLAAEMSAVAAAAADASSAYDARRPGAIVPHLAKGLAAVRAARARLQSLRVNAATTAEAEFLLDHEERAFGEALVLASGLDIDPIATSETVVRGGSVDVTVRTFDYGLAPDTRIGAAHIDAPKGWLTAPAPDGDDTDRDNPFARFFRETPAKSERFRVTVGGDAPFTQPYWLTEPRSGHLFRWGPGAPAGRAFAPPVLSARVSVQIGGIPLDVVRPVEYRFADRVRGEIRRPVVVVPAVDVALESSLLVVPIRSPRDQTVVVRVTSGDGAATGTVSLTPPAGWRVTPAEQSFSLAGRGQATSASFVVQPPQAVTPGSFEMTAQARVGDRVYTDDVQTIAYPHIQTHRLYRKASARVQAFDHSAAPVRVGYVMGSGDQVPDAIRRMGLEVELLDAEALSAGDLSRFDTIVVGVRASEARLDFVANHERLLDYVRNGGTLIVQYQQGDYAERGLAPFPGAIGPRVTEEDAAVTILQPGHPAMTTPNRITAEDFEGWVQERNLYSFGTFDSRYQALLESHDSGEPPNQGGLLYAPLGKGRYVYASYAFFRQLPAGVPGAYRLFANLLSLGAR